MAKIKILSSAIYRKIAAGEVVERPASVVKELLDNALDANSDKVIVEVEKGGISKIKVVDNGDGIEREDLPLVFEHHATSKIATEDDLVRISTMGFRGEALSSIASVSKVSLVSRTNSSSAGYEIIVEGGVVKRIGKRAFNQGTSVSVEDIFYNMPARRKFLKRPATEFNHIINTFINTALFNINISFRLIHNEKEVYDLQKAATLRERITQIFGKNISESLIPVFSGNPHIKISGFVGRPQIAYEGKSKQYILVNKRPIRDRVISSAVKEAFGSLLMGNVYPVYFIEIKTPLDFVDVNVHPRKEEIKFQNAGLIHAVVKQAVSKALFKADVSFTPSKTFSPSKARSYSPVYKPSLIQRDFDRFSKTPKPYYFADVQDAPAEILIFKNTYILVENQGSLEIYDQHALHERILYEKFKKALKERKVSSQQLLVPETLEVSQDDFEILKENLKVLGRIGFDIEIFGKRIFKINAIPSEMRKGSVLSSILGFIEDIKNGEILEGLTSQQERTLSIMACRSAVKARDRLEKQEVRELLEQAKNLSTISRKFTCPHGRPFKIEIKERDLEKMFKRVL